MTGKVDRMDLIEDRAKAVFKESLKVIALTLILTSIVSYLGGKTYDYLSVRGREEVRMERENPESYRDQDFFLKILPTSKNRSYRQALYPGNILLTGLSDMMMAGLFVAIYRQVSEGKAVAFKDVFIFFKKRPIRNSLLVLLLSILRILLYYSLIIPGYYFSLVTFFYPLVLYEALEKDQVSYWDLWKKTVNWSRGRKMLIFTKQFKYGVLFIGLALGLGFIALVLSLGGGPGGPSPLYEAFIKLFSLAIFLVLVAASIWLYMANIEVFEEIRLDQEAADPPSLDEA